MLWTRALVPKLKPRRWLVRLSLPSWAPGFSAPQKLIAAEGARLAEPGSVMMHLNRELTAMLKQTGTVLCVTALYCVFQCEETTLRHARAGHHPPLHVRRGESEMHFAGGAEEIAGPALGLFADARFGTATTQLSPNDLVLLLTDGIIEAENASGSEWGLAGLKQTVRARPTASGRNYSRACSETRRFLPAWPSLSTTPPGGDRTAS